MSLGLSGVHHVAIICLDYERSRYFYTNILGLKVIRETYRSERKSYKLDLAIDEHTELELFSFPDPPARSSNPEAAGLRHLAFSVKDLDASVQVLQDKGVEVEPIRLDELTGKRFTFFQDPDALPLELYEL